MSRPRRAPAPPVTGLREGLVVSAHGRHCVVEPPAGERVICHPRGKKLAVVVGDRVRWLPSQDEGTIERIDERRNLLYRQDEVRTKSFAANLDQVLILLAAEPEFSEHQLARALIACEAEHIAPLIVLNKADLTESFSRAWQRLAPYRAMGYAVLPLAVKPRHPHPGPLPPVGEDAENATPVASRVLPALRLGERAGVRGGPATPPPFAFDELLTRLRGRTTLILGPSGAGKSTLINRAVPGAAAQTGEISQALNSGKHTTTTTTWYWLDGEKNSALIDSPGFQEFGLRHIDPMQLAAYMPDIRPHVAECRFYNCTHLHEPGCGVAEAVKSRSSAGGISANRYKIYSDLFTELKSNA
ncbi:ribosome small subunit-dependent GTPase A [Ottowia testudinis]|uniref:Small ribosomal subunit biogenesis GTPase RsgA n=1 Tax=Ottowia testudinis TaxID=2816950 RepID=A0A975CMH1_9BURK|nr:ribosome small subunit-dependent GTPase A [Ottowia testudinis]QTD46904.1 ribosome small subunit-dependent GTPase A [Ottowia testudinis]